MKILISSGHGKFVAGASDIIDEVTEARKVTNRVAEILKKNGIEVSVFHDDTSKNHRDNINTIVSHHSGQVRELDVSVHFNAVAGTREAGIGVETLYRKGNKKMKQLASNISKAISNSSGLILRRVDGTFPVTNIGFLNSLKNSVLLEICFVNSHTDVRLYRENFEAICQSIAESLIGRSITNGFNTSPKSKKFPLSEKNIEAMVKLGVKNTPEFWRNVDNIKFLDQLLYNASIKGRLDARIYNGIKDIDIAIETLVDAKIMNNPDYWKKVIKANKVKFLEKLIINMANRSRDILERIIHAEARGEDLKGQVLVGNVIMNRVKNGSFPKGLRDVIFQSDVNSEGRMIYQFSPIKDGSYKAAKPSKSVKKAVTQILKGRDESKGATHFHANDGRKRDWIVNAIEQGRMKELFVHGGHIFYKQV